MMIKNNIVGVSDVELTNWILTLPLKERKIFSQNSEDGVLEAVFDFIGETNKIYVEFGAENGSECNTRFLRETKNWNVEESLLMDGRFEDSEINLKKEFFFPDNIVQLFEKYKVKKQFDLLSVDTDSYDFFTLTSILEAGYQPRVIIVEYNSDFDIEDSKSIMPRNSANSATWIAWDGQEFHNKWSLWDGTAYQGMSLLACQYLFNRFSYSMVYCNLVNCVAIRDDILPHPVRLPTKVFHRYNSFITRCDQKKRPMAIIEKNGKWEGRTDNGNGSFYIRC